MNNPVIDETIKRNLRAYAVEMDMYAKQDGSMPNKPDIDWFTKEILTTIHTEVRGLPNKAKEHHGKHAWGSPCNLCGEESMKQTVLELFPV